MFPLKGFFANKHFLNNFNTILINYYIGILEGIEVTRTCTPKLTFRPLGHSDLYKKKHTKTKAYRQYLQRFVSCKLSVLLKRRFTMGCDNSYHYSSRESFRIGSEHGERHVHCYDGIGHLLLAGVASGGGRKEPI